MKPIPVSDPEKMGASLSEVEITYSGVDAQKITTKWFHSGTKKHADADVFIWMDYKDNIIKQQTNISGLIAEWNILDGLRTGMMVEQEIISDAKESSKSPASEAVRYDKNINEYTIHMAIRLIRHVPAVDTATRDLLLRNFQQPDSFQTLNPEEILFRYGKTPAGIKLNFLGRFKVYLRRLLS